MKRTYLYFMYHLRGLFRGNYAYLVITQCTYREIRIRTITWTSRQLCRESKHIIIQWKRFHRVTTICGNCRLRRNHTIATLNEDRERYSAESTSDPWPPSPCWRASPIRWDVSEGILRTTNKLTWFSFELPERASPAFWEVDFSLYGWRWNQYANHVD